MGNGILSQLGINAELMVVVLLVLWIISFIILIVLLVKYNTMKASYTMFMKGSDGESLEEQIGSLFNDIAVLKLSSEKNRNDIRKIIENLKDTYQRVGIVKYDAILGKKTAEWIVDEAANSATSGYSLKQEALWANITDIKTERTENIDFYNWILS